MSIPGSALAILGAATASSDAADYKIERSLRFNSADSAHLSRDFSASDTDTFTFSCWVKGGNYSGEKTIFSGGADANNRALLFFSNNKIYFQSRTGGSVDVTLNTDAVFRDPSAWFHLVLSCQSGSQKIYINSIERASATSTAVTQINTATTHAIGAQAYDTSLEFDGYLAEVYFIDGQALDATYFGNFDDNGVWQPKTFSGQYGGHNQSQNWTDNITLSFYGNAAAGNNSTAIDNVFDGDLSTGFYALDSGVSGSAGLTHKITFPSGVRGSKVRVRVGGDGGYGAALNTETVTNLVAASSSYSWLTIYDGTETDINYIVFGNAGTGTRDNVTSAIEIDGLLLTDSDISVTDNSFRLDFSDNSSYVALGYDAAGSNNWNVNQLVANSANYVNDDTTASNGEIPNGGTPYWVDIVPTGADLSYYAGNEMTLVHDGSTSTNVFWTGDQYGTGNVTRARFDLGSFGTITSLRIYGGYPPASITSYDYQLLDSSKNAIAGTSGTFGTDAWHSLTLSGSPRYIEISCTSGSDRRLRLAAIEVNGAILTNTLPQEIDSFLDSPTNYDDGNVGGNYCTWSPLVASDYTPSSSELVNGNLEGNANKWYFGTQAFKTGKWYWELSGVTNSGIGVYDIDAPKASGDRTGNSVCLFSGAFQGQGTHFTPFSYSTSDLIGLALDADANTLAYYKNGTLEGTVTDLPAGKAWTPFMAWNSSGATAANVANFGQRPFNYPPGETGGPANTFKSLCTQNFDESSYASIPDGSKFVDAKVYTGNGAGIEIGDGTTYSSLLSPSSGSFTANEPATLAFDGLTSTVAKAANANTNITFDLSSLNLTGSLEFYSTNSVSQFSIDGGTTWSDSNTSNWTTATSDISGVANIQFRPNNGTNNNTKMKLAAIRNQDKILINATGDPYSFSPDFVWIKNLTASSTNREHHALFDQVRGATKVLYSSLAYAEATQANGLTSFTSNGVILGTDGKVNRNTDSHVAWAWDAGANSSKTYKVTVVNDSGNKYRFDGHGTSAVTLDLEEGSTYVFDQSDSSNGTGGGHPLRFATQADAANSSQYTTGVTATGTPGQAGAKTTITVASGAPNLYYYCTNHTGMGGQINTNSTAGATVLSGSLNGSVYDQSQIWSSYTAGSVDSNYPATNMFDGDTGTGYATGTKPTTGTSLTWAPTTAITGVETLEIGVYANQDFSVNGTTVTVPASGGQVITVNKSTHFSSGSLNNVEWEYTDTSNYVYITYIKVNGLVLTDSDATPPTIIPTINSTARSNPEVGFSIVTYTSPNNAAAQSFAHGLNAKPDFALIKNRDDSFNWDIYHSALGYNASLQFTDSSTRSGAFSAEPDSNVIHTTTAYTHNGTDNYVALCWTAVEGFSKFGTYTGSSSLPFIYTGFRPSVIFYKTSSQTAKWAIHDTTRSAYNPQVSSIYPDEELEQYTGTAHVVDILSNGFKLRNTNAVFNTAGETYIYAAFSENPLRTARAR